MTGRPDRRAALRGPYPRGMRIVTAEEAVAGIKSGQQIYVQGAAATPSVLLDALVARASELRDVSVVHLHCEGPGPHLAPEMAPHFRHRALFIGPNARAAVNEGRAEYVPVFLSDVPRLFDTGLLPLDAVFVNATPPDAHGFCSLGTSVEAMHSAIRAATTVIVQFNQAVPRTLGDSFIHVSDIDLAVECRVPPYEHRVGPAGEIEARIGQFVADLVPDGATIQMGIGAIPSAVGAALADKRDLGVHTEMFTDVVADLVASGVINGSRKERNRGKIVAAFLMGTQRLYDFVRDNPMIEMRPVDFTNDTHVIRSFSRMTAINSAIEVDLTGQVVADSIGHRMYSGVGGQIDFIRGASLASEGRAIIALPSTAAGRSTSRIVAALKEGAGVVTTRAHARTVVTEWGVAELWGRSLHERAEALIGIADPAFRDQLRSEARRLKLA
ncbi:MAG: acetyl-CoA hydrolase/transferase [Chloroflexi bacterium]|nr:acetyl-CoA hydrolase/transferase [Chloroflexota bacterium]